MIKDRLNMAVNKLLSHRTQRCKHAEEHEKNIKDNIIYTSPSSHEGQRRVHLESPYT